MNLLRLPTDCPASLVSVAKLGKSCGVWLSAGPPNNTFRSPRPNADRVPYLFRWTQGVTETRTESGPSALKGRETVAQGKGAERPPPWVTEPCK